MGGTLHLIMKERIYWSNFQTLSSLREGIEILLTQVPWSEHAEILIVVFGVWNLEICISYKLPGDADAVNS